MKHQEEGVEFLKGRTGAGLFFEMRLGKTLTTLKHLGNMCETDNYPFPCLVVCPLSVIYVWQDEIEKHGFNFRTSVVYGTRLKRLKAIKDEADIYIINFEGMRLFEAELGMKKFNTMIIDESHRCANRQSMQTTAGLRLSRSIKNRYILTGTPITKSPEDIWTQMEIIAPGQFGNFYGFRNRYVEYKKERIKVSGGFREIFKPVKFKNLDELEKRIGQFALRKTKVECLDLPEKIYKTIHCPLSPDQRKHYYSFRSVLATEIASGVLNVTSASSLVQKLQQVCNGFIYDKGKTVYLKDPGKILMLKDLMQELNDKKVIILTSYIADIELIKEALIDRDLLIYDGTPEERRAIQKKFQEEDKPYVFISNVEKVKEGIPLHASHHVIYYGNTYNYATRFQSEDRAHGPMQTRDVTYYDLTVKGTVDEKILHALKEKKSVADAVTGDALRIAKMEIEMMNEREL